MIHWNVLKYTSKTNNNRKILLLNKEEFVVDALGLEVDEGRDYLAISLVEPGNMLWNGDFRMGKPNYGNA